VSGMPQVNPWGQFRVEQSRGLPPEKPLTQSKGNVINIGGGEYGSNTGALPITSDLSDVMQIWSGLALDGTSEEEMANTPHDDQLLDAKLGRAAAETDTKIARCEGKLDLVLSKLDSVRDDYVTTRTNQWVIGLGLAVLIVAVAAIFPVFFSVGAQIRDMVQKEVKAQIPEPPAPPPQQRPNSQK
jgi:hypothetical protein